MEDTPVVVFRMNDELVMLARLGVAAACGILLGLERRRKPQHPTGIRTMAVITSGAAVFMLVSKFGFNGEADSSRIAAQVVSGVGFLGAGIMFLNRNRVRNLTTASTIWLAAGVGLAAGAGLFVLAGAATLGSVAVLYLIPARNRDVTDSNESDDEPDD